jgi:hypothetical protein
MFIRIGGQIGLSCLGAAFCLLAVVAAAISLAAPAPFPRPAHPHTRTYRFTARIKNNEGITPFKRGQLITGSFTYDLKSKAVRTNGRTYGHYESARNSFSFQTGGLRFTGVGDVTVTVSTFDHAEHFGIVAPDLKLPKGWEMDHTRRSQTYSILLQNAPSKKAITRLAIPDRVKLSDFVSTRELRLDFFHGVRFPGGTVKERATLCAPLLSIQEVRR